MVSGSDSGEGPHTQVKLSKGKEKWKCPPYPWLKCNLGVFWSSVNRMAGASWVLRGSCRKVLLYSRKYFAEIKDLDEASFKILSWAIESMADHKMNKVIFALNAANLVKAMNRPIAWPSFSYQVSELSVFLRRIQEWKVVVEIPSINRGVTLIAQSVTRDNRIQSYVALGHPRWLHNLFISENFLPSS